MDAIDFENVVDRAASLVEREKNVTIERDARGILIDRARAHEADIYKTLSDLNLSEQDLENAAADQFRDAVEIHRRKYPIVFPGGRRAIDLTTVEQGMRWRCHFVPWC